MLVLFLFHFFVVFFLLSILVLVDCSSGGVDVVAVVVTIRRQLHFRCLAIIGVMVFLLKLSFKYFIWFGCYCWRNYFGRARSRRIIRIWTAIWMHWEERIPATDMLAQINFIQIDFGAAKSLIVLETNTALP